jgi:hypothetical protein
MRLSRADPAMVAAYMRRRWFDIAPNKLHAAFEEAHPAAKQAGVAKKSANKKASKTLARSKRQVVT